MKAECIKDKFQKAITKAEKITGKNMTLPVLSCVLIEAKDNYLLIKATNLDLGVEIKVPAKIISSGVLAVPGNILNGFLNNSSEGEKIKIEGREGNLFIESSDSQATIKGLPVDDFPTIPQINDGKTFELNSTDLVNGLRSVSYSASLSTVKPELSSVYIYSDNEELNFVATDSFRLAEKKIKVKKNVAVDHLLIPFKNVSDLLKIITDDREILEIGCNKNQISFKYGDVYLVSRVIDGVFPDYKQIIPKEFKTEAIVLKKDLINNLKLSNVFTDSFNQMNIKISVVNKNLEFKTKNSSVGENQNKLSGAISGEDLEINFNHKYIIDCFQSIDSDSVSLSFNGLNKPVVIKGVSDKSFTYLVMPMNR